MNENLAVLFAAILCTVAQTGSAPAGVMYAAVLGKCSHFEFDALIRIMESKGLVARAPSHLVSITPAGRELAARLEEVGK
jgi:hypothetical protein